MPPKRPWCWDCQGNLQVARACGECTTLFNYPDGNKIIADWRAEKNLHTKHPCALWKSAKKSAAATAAAAAAAAATPSTDSEDEHDTRLRTEPQQPDHLRQEASAYERSIAAAFDNNSSYVDHEIGGGPSRAGAGARRSMRTRKTRKTH